LQLSSGKIFLPKDIGDVAFLWRAYAQVENVDIYLEDEDRSGMASVSQFGLCQVLTNIFGKPRKCVFGDSAITLSPSCGEGNHLAFGAALPCQRSVSRTQ